MTNPNSNDNGLTMDRILRERLEQYNVPQEVRAALRAEIMAFFGRPERKPFGACTMTIEASVAADRERTQKRFDPDGPKPQII